MESLDLPKSWRLLPVGKVLLDSQYGTNVPNIDGGNTKIIGMKDIQNGKVVTYNLASSNLPEEEKKNFLLQIGDILINRTNSYDLVGKVGIFKSKEEVVFASYLVRLKTDRKQILPEYLNYWLNTHIAQKTIKRIATKAISQANVNPTEFKKYCLVPIPLLSEQKDIADLLSTWDQVIETTEKLIAAKEKQKQAYMKLLLTGRKRLQGFVDKWRTFQLGDLFVERRESANDHLPLLSITREQGVIPRTDVDRKDTSSEDKSKYLRICPGDIGYNTMRMWQGVSALSSIEGIVSPAYTICVPNMDLDGLFMSYLFKLPAVIHLFYRYSQGLTSDTWNLKFRHFREIKVTIPQLEEQKTIAEVFSTFDLEINLLRKQLDLLKKQKRGLMQKLLTGQWRVTKYKEVI